MPNPTAHPAAVTETAKPIVSGLTGRRRFFCQRIAAGANGAEAARAAGFSAAAAAQQAYRLLRDPAVAAEIERLRQDMELRMQAELDRLLAKVEGVFAKAIRDGQCSPALRAIEMEALLRARGARSLPDGVLPADVEPAEVEPADTEPADTEPSPAEEKASAPLVRPRNAGASASRRKAPDRPATPGPAAAARQARRPDRS